MGRVIKLLMERDGISEDEAREQCTSVKEQIDEIVDTNTGFSTLEQIEEIIADELGLEPDYIDDFLF